MSTFWHETADVILNSSFGLIGKQKQFSQVHLFDPSKSHHTPEKQAKEQKKFHMQPWKALEPNSRARQYTLCKNAIFCPKNSDLKWPQFCHFLNKKQTFGTVCTVQLRTLLESLKLWPKIPFLETFKIAKLNFWVKK